MLNTATCGSSEGFRGTGMVVDAPPAIIPGNYVSSSQPGCHIAHYDAEWVIEAGDFDLEDYGLEPEDEKDVPEIIIDPETRSLSAINTEYDTDKSFFITTKHAAFDGERRKMAAGPTRTSEGREERVTTLVLVVKPRAVIEACYLDVTEGQACGEEELDLFSDIKNVKPHPKPSAWESKHAYPFPLGGDGPYLCSQGVGGCFTHFYPGTHHALDFECAEGTQVQALASGTVKEIRQSTTAGGIHAKGLFEWNSITVLQEDGLLAEYVHILAGSALVEPGDHVTAGQPLCLSGGAGFCPKPHLHLQLQEGEGDTAPTVYFAFLDLEGNPYFPVAGKWYSDQGEAPAPLKLREEDLLGRKALEASAGGTDGPDAKESSDGQASCEEFEPASGGTPTLPSACR
ncbi:unnamed protein product [Scytosiphon promiscuus]